MEHDFWLSRWRDNLIGFHQSETSPALAAYLDRLQLAPGDQVFFPLCGKSLDMSWLQEHGFRVLGVELSPIAAADFFKEAGREASISTVGEFESRRSGDIEILCGDFFAMEKAAAHEVRAVFDRAALIALPPEMRRTYAEKMTQLLDPGCRVLMVTLEYPQSEMDGPPFSVSEDEVRDLYGAGFSINVLDEKDVLAGEPKFRERGLSSLVEKTYLLEKRHN